MPNLILRLRHGSHLYRTNHATSDEDWYEVWDRLPGRRQAKQTITGDQDVMRLGLSEFMRQVDAGVPQALEAMLARPSMVDVDTWMRWRLSYHPDTGRAAATYARTIEAFGKVKPTVKRQRHAVRLTYQRDQIIRYGRFDPSDRSWVATLPEALRFPGTEERAGV